MDFLIASDVGDTLLGPGGAAAPVAEVGIEPISGQVPIQQESNIWSMVLLWVGMFAVMYMFMIRPQRKRQKEMAAMQQSLKIGDGVVTNSGMFGKIVDIGPDTYTIEFGEIKSVLIPVRKTDIAGIAEPSK